MVYKVGCLILFLWCAGLAWYILLLRQQIVNCERRAESEKAGFENWKAILQSKPSREDVLGVLEAVEIALEKERSLRMEAEDRLNEVLNG